MFACRRAKKYCARSCSRSFISLFKKSKSLNDIEVLDIYRLEKILPVASSIHDMPLKFEHPLHSICKTLINNGCKYDNIKSSVDVCIIV